MLLMVQNLGKIQNISLDGITAPTLYDDYIYFGDVEGYLHKVDPATGEIVGLQATNLKSVSQIEAFANKLIVQDSAGSVSAFELK